MNKRIVLAVPFLLFFLSSCGTQEQGSTAKTITAPDDKPYKPVDDFWLYETGNGISAFTFDSTVPAVGYFPAAIPTNGQDLFWMKDPLTSMSLIPDTNVVKPRHRENLINRIRFPIASGASGSFANGSIVHRLFEGMKTDTNSTLILRPTFEVRGSIGSSVQAHFESRSLCYKILPGDPDPVRILKEETAQTDRVLTLSRPGEAETLAPELGFNRSNVGSFAEQCTTLGGEVSSQIVFEVRPLLQSGELLADFVGVAIHREFPALDKSKIFFVASPNLPLNRDLKLEVESLENKDMACNILLKGKYASQADSQSMFSTLIRKDIVVLNKTMSNEDTYLGGAELNAVGIPGIRYVGVDVMSYDCVEYIPRVR